MPDVTAQPQAELYAGGTRTSRTLHPSGAVRNGICRTSFADTYCSLGCRFAESATGGAHLCPSGAVRDGFLNRRIVLTLFLRAEPLDFSGIGDKLLSYFEGKVGFG